MQTEAQLFDQFRDFMARRANQDAAQAGGLPKHYHGPIDLNYVRPPGTEFPKLCYKASTVDPRGYKTKLVQNKAEQDKLPKGWLTTTEDIFKLLDPIYQAQYKTADDEQVEELASKVK